MQQTILALGALMIIMITALNHQRSVLMIQEASYVRELEGIALDLAKQRIERRLFETQFDEQWLNQADLPASPNVLTAAADLGRDAGDVGRDDIDDFHNVTERVNHVVGADTFQFNVSYSISYIDTATGDTTSTPSFAKQITASVVSADTLGTRIARASFSKTTIISNDF